ncbi:MAG: CoA pyrophosphatase [Actinobacteria bacterium]|nr:CoA pyrophosphatase [Actinomycetota bacterium]
MSNPSRRPGGRQTLPRPLQWRELSHSPWSRLDLSALGDIDAIESALQNHRPNPESQQPPAHAQPSAVLVPLFVAADGPRVLLTRRSESLNSHKGQIAFPGGRLEAGESSLDAAMRETREEIGIDASTARVVGELPAHRTISSSSHIVPHVVRLPSEPQQFALNGEVDRVFSVSLGELVRADTFVQEHWVFQDREVVIPMFYLDDETIWGATARMLQELILLAVSR